MVSIPIPVLVALFILSASIGALLLALHRAASIDQLKEQVALEIQRLQLEVLREAAAESRQRGDDRFRPAA